MQAQSGKEQGKHIFASHVASAIIQTLRILALFRFFRRFPPPRPAEIEKADWPMFFFFGEMPGIEPGTSCFPNEVGDQTLQKRPIVAYSGLPCLFPPPGPAMAYEIENACEKYF